MSIKDAYDALGADYGDVEKRFGGDAMVERFAGKFCDDDSMEKLADGMEARDAKAAFVAAHTLKGICANLSLTNLYGPVCDLVEVLRPGTLEGSEEPYAQVKDEYRKTVAALRAARG